MSSNSDKVNELKDAYKKLNSLRFLGAFSEIEAEQIQNMLKSLENQLKTEFFKDFLREE